MAEDNSELEGVPRAGEIVVGKYRVDRVLGVGGMGCVVAATHTTLDQPVAIKFLLVKAAKNPKNILRFQREAQAAAKIKSDHVAKVSDVGTLENGTPFMVMEYLDGEDLSERLLNSGRLAADEAVRYVLQACEALAEAHRAGIIHRDLKPANLFVAGAPDGSVRIKVLDFGISKIIDEKDDLTKTSALMGSPLYMSPEQMMSAKAADARADIWALGCILFELISGHPPFVGNTLPEICSRILTAPPTDLASLVPVNSALVAVILHTLSKKPEERYQNLAEFSHALYRFGGEQAARSASIVCRVLNAPHLSPASTELPRSMGDASGQHHQQSYAQTHPSLAAGAAAQTPLPHSPSTPGHAGMPAHGASPPVAPHPQIGHMPHVPGAPVVAYPQGASTSQDHYPGVAAHTAPSAGMVTAGPGLPAAGVPVGPAGGVPGAGVPAGVAPSVMAQGASTGAPVAQTMSGDTPRRSRVPLFIGLGAVLALAAVGGVVVVGMSRNAPAAESTISQPSPATSSAAKKTVAGTVASQAPSTDDVKEAPPPAPSASEQAPTVPPSRRQKPAATPTTATPQKGKTPTPVLIQPPPPRPPPPRGGTKTGDDAF